MVLAEASFPAQTTGCPPPLADESGVIALGTGGTPPIGDDALMTNDPDASYLGPFAPNVPFADLRGEPSGFSRATLDGGWIVTAYANDGRILATSSGNLGANDTAAVAPLPSGGYAIVVGDAAARNTFFKRFARHPPGR